MSFLLEEVRNRHEDDKNNHDSDFGLSLLTRTASLKKQALRIILINGEHLVTQRTRKRGLLRN